MVDISLETVRVSCHFLRFYWTLLCQGVTYGCWDILFQCVVYGGKITRISFHCLMRRP